MIRLSFKRYWREHATHPVLRGKPRRWRRWQALQWYRAGKHPQHEPLGIVSYAGVAT